MNMPAHHTLGLFLTLQDDTLFSESSATEGGLRTLLFVPGASIWGAVAARLYGSFLTRNLHHAAFHQDRLRFLDGMPLATSGYAALPAPAVWQQKKNADLNTLTDDLLNLAARSPEDGVQRKSLRNKAIAADGRVVTPTTCTVLKTALAQGTERVRDGQLFAYESLCSGQHFYAEVHADADLDTDIWNEVRAMLENTTLRLGRSRSAQYGRVSCTAVNPRPLHWGWPLGSSCKAPNCAGPARMVIWCVSDLALLDAFGQPTVTPLVSDFGLNPFEWRYTPAHSSINVRRYSPFNAHRQSHDSERLVIQRGSVLCFDATNASATKFDASALTALRQRLATGVGLHRANGLGQVLVQPAWSEDEFVNFRPSTLHGPVLFEAKKSAPVETSADREFLAWLQTKCGQGVFSDDLASQIANHIASDLRSVIDYATRLAGGNTTSVTPSRSQWGLLVEAGKNAQTMAELLHALGNGPLEGAKAPSGVTPPWPENSLARGKKNKVWFAASFCPNNKATTLGDHLLAQLQTRLSTASTVRPGAVLAKLANAMRSGTEQKSRKEAA
jgi:CRISPR-associated protein Csx10